MDWDLMRTVLAIGQHGTQSAAARALGVNQTTVARRLEAAEQAVGGPLFLRLGSRWQPTEAGLLALEQATRMDVAAQAFSHAVTDSLGTVSGTVEITATEGIISALLMPSLGDLRAQFPALTLVIAADHENRDLLSRQADIALRLSRPDPHGPEGLRARKVGEIAHAVYGPKTPSPEHSSPEHSSPETLPWLAYSQPFATLPESQWLASQPGGTTPALRTNSLAALVSGVANGLGRAVLPCYAADRCPEIQPLTPPVVWRDLWLVMHHEVARLPRVRAVADWLTHSFHRQRALLRGGFPHP